MTSVERLVIHPVGIIEDARHETLEGIPVKVFFVLKPMGCLLIPALQLFEQSFLTESTNQLFSVLDPNLFFNVTNFRHDTDTVSPGFLILGTVVANKTYRCDTSDEYLRTKVPAEH